MKRLSLFTTMRVRYRFTQSKLNSNVQNIKKLNAMKRVSLFAGLFLLMSSTLFAQDPFSVHSFSPSVTSSIRSVEATTQNGAITVNGNATSEAVVEMFVSSNFSGEFVLLNRAVRRKNENIEDIRRILEEEYIIDIGVENGKLYATARPKDQRVRQKLNISFRISVPERVNCELRTSNGSIRINNLTGSQNFRTSNASVTIDNVSGKITGTTSNGSIKVTNSGDEINITTSNGGITARNLLGAITFRTSNGGVNISDLNGVISVTTSNGGITANNINGRFGVATSNGGMRLSNMSGSVNARTTNGGITATMVSVIGGVTMTTSNGQINLSVPAGRNYDLKARGQRITTSGLANFSGRIDDRNLDGRTGNGGATIDLTTSGRVRLSFD